MEKLSLEHFLAAGTDPESARYRILAHLKKCAEDFDHNKLYPELSDLIALKNSLEAIVNGKSKLVNELPPNLKGIDLKKKKLIFEKQDITCSPLDAVIKLIQWALPEIEKAINEGTHIYDFVEENLAIK